MDNRQSIVMFPPGIPEIGGEEATENCEASHRFKTTPKSWMRRVTIQVHREISSWTGKLKCIDFFILCYDFPFRFCKVSRLSQSQLIQIQG